MSTERRRYPRVKRPLECKWQGASGGGLTRIADLSLGGCFINTLAMPRPGERITMTVKIDDSRVSLEGRVVYAEPAMGFAVKFEDLSEDMRTQLENMITLISRA